MNRFKQIDILRALAIFLVLGRHMNPCPTDVNPFLHYLTAIWCQGGWIGVDLFFVLSGFLVSGLLFREYEKYRELRIWDFLIRRGFKIYPSFWAFIGATVAVGIVRCDDLPWRGVASELLFLQNYHAALWNHTWSLAVEEHFYLLLGLTFFWSVRCNASEPFRFIPWAFILIAFACLALRIHMGFHAPYDHKTHLFATHLRLDGLFFGVLLSYYFHRFPDAFLVTAQRFRHRLAVIGAVLFLPAFLLPLESTPFIYTFGVTLFYLGSGCLVIAAIGFRNPSSPLGVAFAYLGSHSYSVYLWHMPVALWGGGLLKRLLGEQYNWYTYATVYLVGSVCFGICMSLLIEFPVLRIRDRLFPSRARPLNYGKS